METLLLNNIKNNEPIFITKKTTRINYQNPMPKKYETTFKYKCRDKSTQHKHFQTLIEFVINNNYSKLTPLTEYMRARYVNIEIFNLLKNNEISSVLKPTTIKKLVRIMLKNTSFNN